MLRFQPMLNISEKTNLVYSKWEWNQTKQEHLDRNQQNILTLDNWPSNNMIIIFKKQDDQLLAVISPVFF